MRGLPFDPATHAATIRDWELEYAEQRALFRQQTGPGSTGRRSGDPRLAAAAPARRKHTTPGRSTDTGLLKTGADEIKRLAQDWPEVLPLLEVQKKEKRLSTFGAALLDRVSTVTGRLHGDYALPTVTGPTDLSKAEPTTAANRCARRRPCRAGQGLLVRRLRPDRATHPGRARRRGGHARRLRCRQGHPHHDGRLVSRTGPSRHRDRPSNARRSAYPGTTAPWRRPTTPARPPAAGPIELPSAGHGRPGECPRRQ